MLLAFIFNADSYLFGCGRIQRDQGVFFARPELNPREILFAVVGAVLEINQIRLVRPFKIGTRRSEPGRSSAAALRQSHQSGTLVQSREGDSGHPERRQSSPAHAHAAGAGHAWCNQKRQNFIIFIGILL